jgi:hypothetical protein
MSIKQVRNKIMEHIINGNNYREINSSNKVTLEPYVNRANNVEQNYIPFIDINYNKNPLKSATIYPNHEIPNDNLTQIYIVGLSCLGLYMLNSIIKKK